jgi:hypothetical protein
MATRAWSVSSAADVLAYLRSRFPARLSGPLAVFLGTAALATGPHPSPAAVLLTTALAGSLVLQFRLWDDLADLPQDRRRHPDRILSRARTTRPFRRLLAATVALNVGLLAVRPGAGPRLVALGLLGAALGVWYGRLREIWPHPVLAYHVVLAKYPVFVCLLSAPGGSVRRLVVAMALVYLCVGVYEALHDPALARAPAVPGVLILEMAGLVAVSALASAGVGGRGLPAALITGAGLAAGAGALAGLYARNRSGGEPGPWGYAVFVLGFGALLTLSLEASP